MKRKTLSIVLTAHNCEAYLYKTLASIYPSLAGLKEGYEIILISDASVDRTAEILQEFANHHAQNTRLFQVDFCNIGMVRNFCAKQCIGDYITMIDGDDWLLAGALYDIIHFLSDSKPELLLTNLNEVYGEENLVTQWAGLKIEILSQPQAIKKFLIHKEIQAHFIGQFVKRELLLVYPFPEFHCYEDVYLFPTILSHCQEIIFSRTSHYLYFKHDNSLSSQIDVTKINLLVQATEEMERVLSCKYANLIACHWINILHRYNRNMNNTINRQKIIKRIKDIDLFSFLLDPTIRLSFKKNILR